MVGGMQSDPISAKDGGCSRRSRNRRRVRTGIGVRLSCWISERRVHVYGAILGVSVWFMFADWASHDEAWDHPLWGRIGWPLMILSGFVLGFCAPRQGWRCGITPHAVQWLLAMIVSWDSNLLPVAVVFWAIEASPSIAAAACGSLIRKRLGQG